jgi:hypothetical protein
VSLRNIGIVYRKELVDSLRDTRTLISTIAVPLLLMPLLTIGLGVVTVRQVGQAREEIPKVMILGGEDSPNLRAELAKLEGVQIVPQEPDYAEEISSKQIRAAVQIPEGFDAKLAAGEPMSVRIYMYEGELKSGFGADRMQNFFRDLRERAIRERLQARQLPESLIRPFDIKQQNVAPPEKVGGAILGGLVPYFVILLCLTGARNNRNDSVQPGFAHPFGPGEIPDGPHGFGRDGRPFNHLDDGFVCGGQEIAAGRRQWRRRPNYSDHHDRESSALRFHHGPPFGGAVFRGTAGDCVVCQELQGSAELHLAPNDCCGPARRRGSAAGRGAEYHACAPAGPEHESGQQGNHDRNLSLEIHRLDLYIVVRLRGRSHRDRREAFSAGRRAVQNLKNTGS